MRRFSFTKRYIFALSIIALLSALAYFNLNRLITSQYNSGKLINLSGQQRMLSQQISLHAIYYKTHALRENIKQMEQNHKYLTSMPMSKELKELYFSNKIYIDKNRKDYINEISKRVKSEYISEPVMLDKKVKEYLKHAKNFLETRSGVSLTYLLQHSKPLLKDLDKATSLYVKEAQDNTNTLKRVELLIFILTLITLLLEALFIFRPANRQIIEDTKIITKEKNYSNTVIESNTNAIVTLDKDLKIKTFNKRAEDIFKYKKEELLNSTSFYKLIPAFNDIKDLNSLLEYIKENGLNEAKELIALDKNQTKFPIRVSFGITKEINDTIIVANIQNIQKEKLKDKILEHQAKFAALGEMIAIIAHQWRQPLAQLSFNNIFLKKHIKDKELYEELKSNEEIISFMSETISNFENFYKKGDNKEFNPQESIEQALKIVDSVIKLKEIKVTKNYSNGSKIYGNPNSLAQVVLSILQNALDVIKLRQIKEPKITINLKENSKEIILEFIDNAGGIKVEPISNIFKPFISKKVVPSSGIGLYMSQFVIKEKFKGKIEATNLKEGAKFTIRLPKKALLKLN